MPTPNNEMLSYPKISAAGGVDLLPYAAAINAALMAGAMSRVLTMSLTYVNERQQFDRTLGQFQAIQHQLSLMAEDVATANVAARIGWSGSGLAIDRWRAAIAKCIANESAAAVSKNGWGGATVDFVRNR
jgi:acyl-CoA dehydrogenase